MAIKGQRRPMTGRTVVGAGARKKKPAVVAQAMQGATRRRKNSWRS